MCPTRRAPLAPRTSLAAAALLAVAVAAGASPASADITGTVFELPRVAILAVDATLDDATASTTVTDVDGKPVVFAELGTVRVTDTRTVSLPWSYNVAVPADFEPIAGKQDKTPRSGEKASKAGTRFRIAQAAAGYPRAVYDQRTEWKKVDVAGEVAGLLRKTSTELDFVSGTTSFSPQMEIELPADTPAGAYQVTVTHSLS